MTTKSPFFTVRTSAPDGLDDADCLVPHPTAGLANRRESPVRPKIAAADAGAADGDERVGRLNSLGIRDVLDANVAGSVHDSCTHNDLPLSSGIFRTAVLADVVHTFYQA
jgi:hypothetical protein